MTDITDLEAMGKLAIENLVYRVHELESLLEQEREKRIAAEDAVSFMCKAVILIQKCFRGYNSRKSQRDDFFCGPQHAHLTEGPEEYMRRYFMATPEEKKKFQTWSWYPSIQSVKNNL